MLDPSLEDISKLRVYKDTISNSWKTAMFIYSMSILHAQWLQATGHKVLVRCGMTLCMHIALDAQMRGWLLAHLGL